MHTIVPFVEPDWSIYIGFQGPQSVQDSIAKKNQFCDSEFLWWVFVIQSTCSWIPKEPDPSYELRWLPQSCPNQLPPFLACGTEWKLGFYQSTSLHLKCRGRLNRSRKAIKDSSSLIATNACNNSFHWTWFVWSIYIDFQSLDLWGSPLLRRTNFDSRWFFPFRSPFLENALRVETGRFGVFFRRWCDCVLARWTADMGQPTPNPVSEPN